MLAVFASGLDDYYASHGIAVCDAVMVICATFRFSLTSQSGLNRCFNRDKARFGCLRDPTRLSVLKAGSDEYANPRSSQRAPACSE